MKTAAIFLASTVLTSGLLAVPAVAGELPAVDGVNGKLELFGTGTKPPPTYWNLGGWNPDRRWRAGGGGAGAVTFPLGGSFGAQVESMLAVWNGKSVVGVGGHLFWRDPSVGLFGVYGSGSYFGTVSGIGVARAAVEGELYLGRFTLEGMVGVEGGKRRYDAGYFNVNAFGAPYFASSAWGLKTRFYDKVAVAYYVTDNFKLSVGQLYTGGKAMATLGAEYGFALAPGMAGSVFVDGHIGGRNTAGVRGGVKVYFGQSDKTLIRRHREDDPVINLPTDLVTLSNTPNTVVTPLPQATTPTCMFEGMVIPCGKPPS